MTLTPNPMPAGQSCGTCRFAGTHVSAGDKDRVLVRCLRYPPTRLTASVRYNDPRSDLQIAHDATRWPVTTWDEWCGEWAARLPTKAEVLDKIEGFVDSHGSPS
jgi:hypothetical protein